MSNLSSVWAIIRAFRGLDSRITALEGGGGGGGAQPRTTATITTASLASDASETGHVTLAKSYRLLRVAMDRAARLELYTTDAKRDADAGRAQGTDPTGDHGVVLDVALGGGDYTGILDLDLVPEVLGASLEDAPSTSIPYRVTNLSGSASPVAVTLTYQEIEA